MTEPTDEALYNKVKAEVDKTYTKPSAYRSMAYTRFYLKEFKDKYGDTKKAYKGKKAANLNKWREEEWIDIKSYLRDPKNPTACGNEPYKKGEYPLCMPEKQAGKYSRGELELLVKRKSELGKKRLVKDAYLRDVLKPEETPATRIYKDKYQTDKKLKLPKPVPEKEAEKILAEPPIAKEKKKKGKKQEEDMQEVTVPTIEKPKRGRGRPRLSEEAKARTKAAALERRKEKRKQESAGREEERKQAKQQKAEERDQRQREIEQEKLRQRQEREENRKPVAPEGPASPEEWEEYRRRKVAYDQRLKDRNFASPSVSFDRGTRVISFV